MLLKIENILNDEGDGWNGWKELPMRILGITVKAYDEFDLVTKSCVWFQLWKSAIYLPKLMLAINPILLKNAFETVEKVQLLPFVEIHI